MKSFFSFLLVVVFFSCTHKAYDTPDGVPLDEPITLEYWSISDLLASVSGVDISEITENVFIKGIVIANDQSGNLYQQIIIDDGTAAIPVLLDAYNLYGMFPLGSKVYIKCKGLFIGRYYKLPRLGFRSESVSDIEAIPFHLWSNYLTLSKEREQVTPLPVMLSEVKKAREELYSRYVSIEEIQFVDTEVLAYAPEPLLASAGNLFLTDCSMDTIALRTSAYAAFRSVAPPRLKGRIAAIYSVYNNTPQLILLDTTDIHMNSPRCK